MRRKSKENDIESPHSHITYNIYNIVFWYFVKCCKLLCAISVTCENANLHMEKIPFIT